MIRWGFIFIVTSVAAISVSAAGAADKSFNPFTYDYRTEATLATKLDVDNPDPDQLREIYALRRQRVMQAMPAGAMLIYSVERTQERRLEFQVPHSDNHDFLYLTGLDGIEGLDSALLLCTSGANDAAGRLDEPVRSWAVLYTSADPAFGFTPYRDCRRPLIRCTRKRSIGCDDGLSRLAHYAGAALAAGRRAVARSWGETDKVLYLNYPRFFRLGMPEPARLEAFQRIQRFSPEIRARDSADILDQVRMLHDSWSLANLRRAVDITGDGIVEAFRATRPGHELSKQVMEIDGFCVPLPWRNPRLPHIGAP